MFASIGPGMKFRFVLFDCGANHHTCKAAFKGKRFAVPFDRISTAFRGVIFLDSPAFSLYDFRMRSTETIVRQGVVFILSIAILSLPMPSISTCCCANSLITSCAGECCCSVSGCCSEPSASEAAPCCCASAGCQDLGASVSQAGDSLVDCCCNGKCRCGDRSTLCATSTFSGRVKKPGVELVTSFLDWTFVPADRSDSRKGFASQSRMRGLPDNLRHAQLQVWLM